MKGVTMKISDIVALAKAGYTPKDVLKLLEMVETSPEVQKAEAEVKEDGAVEIKKEEPKVEPEAPKAKTDDIETLINLLKEE